jgi:hypothetical protein
LFIYYFLNRGYKIWSQPMVNFSFGSWELKTVTEEISAVKEGMGWLEYSNTDNHFCIYYGWGVYMILNCNENNIMQN